VLLKDRENLINICLLTSQKRTISVCVTGGHLADYAGHVTESVRA